MAPAPISRAAVAKVMGDSPISPPPPPSDGVSAASSAIWHDVECGGYTADLALWQRLASQADDPILELGCGTGRVGLDLAKRGRTVIGVDCDAGLVKALNGRAKGLALRAEIADARNFQLSSEFGLALAPMQLVQLLGGAEQRVACLRCVASHLRPGARVALAIVELMPGLQAGGSPLPDICEVEGWAYSSLPIETRVGADSIFIRRLRQVVSPTGELSEEVIEIGLRPLSAELLESEGVAAGLIASGRREIPATDANVGSTVILLEKAP